MLLLWWVSGCTTLNISESQIMQPMHSDVASVQVIASLPEGYQQHTHWVEQEDGRRAYGVSARHPDNSITILYFGGNAFDVSSQGAGIVEAFTKMNVNIFLFDHPGYGKSTGTPSVESLKSNAVANFDYVKSMVKGKLLVHGLSLGSFEAAHVAMRRPVDALVLEAGATNVTEWADTLVPWYATPFVKLEIDDKLTKVDNVEVVQSQTAPLLIMVGEDDQQTPPQLSKKLYQEAITTRKRYHVFRGLKHGEVMGDTAVYTVYSAFLKSLENPGDGNAEPSLSLKSLP